MAIKKYATLNTLSKFLDNLKNLFATKTEMNTKANKSHSHSISDIDNLQTAKALSACRNGWVLVWSDYDTTNETASNGDCFTTVIPKWNPNHVKWSGQSFIAVIPTNLSDTGTVTFAGKRLYVHDAKITGNTVNDVSPSNDVCLRAIYEY